MSALDYAELFGFDLIRHSPVLLLGLFGLWRSRIRREQLGQAYATASWGFATLAMHALLSAARDVASVAVRINAEVTAQSPSEIGVALTLVAVPAYLALLLALVLLGRAVLFGHTSDAAANHSSTSGREVAA
jgi:hypothetical protein